MIFPRFASRTALAAIALLAGGAAHATTADDTIDPTHLIAAYHAAVVGHDGERLARLFVPEGSAWFSVLSDRALAKLRSSKPDTPKLRPGNVAGFVQMVTTSTAQLDPEHSNLRIVSDGEIASVTFDFRFLIDGKEQNRGAESWQLIKGSDGWRIVSIVFSSTPALAAKPG